MRVRRVVTGQTPAGTSVVASDELVDGTTLAHAGATFHRIWGSDAPVTLPDDGSARRQDGYFPPANGFRFGLFTVPPERPGAAVDAAPALAEMARKLPGLAESLELDHPGMHTTDTVDFCLVLSGEVWLELDDGALVELHAGDCVIQNGTRHGWYNRSEQPCVLAVAMVGARREGRGQNGPNPNATAS